MIFRFSFTLTLDESQQQQRRQLLAYYATVAQISFLAVLVAIRIYLALSWLENKWFSGGKDARPGSPHVKYNRLAVSTSWSVRARRYWQRWRWWLGEPILMGWGTIGEWLAGGAWLAWLLLLSYLQTAPDYLHLTKRFGIIGASQLPFHYLLAMKSSCSPIQLITHMSHEELNIGHRILGRIIYICLTLHAGFYLNFFILSDLFGKRIRDRDVILGLTSIFIFTIVGTTALGFLRRWNYRVFYMTHIFAATILLPLLYFHVQYVRPFIWETAAIYIANGLLRFFNARTYSAEISVIPNTNLVRVNLQLTSSTGKWKPGQHLYLCLPTSQRSDVWGLHRLRTNPFTIASIPNEEGRLLLVARVLNGNTRSLITHAQTAISCRYCELRNLACNGPDLLGDGRCNNCRCYSRPFEDCIVKGTIISLIVEGPYGASARLPDFLLFDRVLLVAGGVGATFIVPIWRHIVNSRQRNYLHKDGDVRFVWAVKKLVETTWAFPLKQRESKRGSRMGGVEIHVTGQAEVNGEDEHLGESFELVEQDQLMGENDKHDKGLLAQGITVKYMRPDLYEVVDEIFSGHVEKMAVLICGPTSMGRQLRKDIGKWVRRGKDVYWHAEIFGF